jgi:predicted small lipoprotein YifL
MNRLRPVAAVMLAAFLLSACGKKGPLYRPDEAPPKKEQSPPAGSPAEEASPAN